MNKNHWLNRLQDRWGLQSITQVVIVLIVFACTGFTVLYIKKPIFYWLGVHSETSTFWKVFIYLLTILPAYQLFLLFYGFIFGQFRFFWEFEKRMFRRMSKLFPRF